MTRGVRVDNGASPDGQGRSHVGDLGWLLNDLVARVHEIDKAVILTRDGLVTGASQDLTREDA